MVHSPGADRERLTRDFSGRSETLSELRGDDSRLFSTDMRDGICRPVSVSGVHTLRLDGTRRKFSPFRASFQEVLPVFLQLTAQAEYILP